MDFEFFEQLTEDAAQTYLDRYLEVEALEVEDSIRKASADGVTVDFSVDSIPNFFAWLLQFVKKVVQEPEPDMPDWLREANENMGAFIGFADESSGLVLRGSYYLGESFVRSHPKLHWRVGRPKTADQNAPVVAGFRKRMELPALLVAENIVLRALRDPSDKGRARDVIEVWKEKI